MEMRSKIRARRRRNRKWFIFVGMILVIIALVTIFLSIIMAPFNNAYDKYTAKAQETYKLSEVGAFYQSTRDGLYYTVIGKNSKSQKVAVIYKDKHDKATVVKMSNGKSKKQIETVTKANYDTKKITSIGMAIYKKVPVWEVSFIDKSDNLNFITYQFTTGKAVRVIRHL